MLVQTIEHMDGKNVVTLGDSIIKHVSSWGIAVKSKKCKLFVKGFSWAKVRCLKDNMKPSVRKNPDHFILHIGTNDLNSDKSPELIAKSLADVGPSLKNELRDVSISSITARMRSLKKKLLKLFSKTLYRKKYIFHKS